MLSSPPNRLQWSARPSRPRTLYARPVIRVGVPADRLRYEVFGLYL